MDQEFSVGDRVSARGLAWDVIEVAALGAQTLLRVRCVEGDLGGLEWDVLHPAEPVALLRSDLRPETPGSLAAWRLYHRACLLEQVLGPEDLQLASPGGVRIEPYQLVPLIRVLEMPRPRLLLADGVGLGKTIEAGLIACELIARRRAHRVLVVAPAGPLLTQWAQEMRQRFGLQFVAVSDATSLQTQRRRLELGGNPFDAIALCLTSLDFAKQERVLEELERSAWDLAIIDEAHHCISSGSSTDRDATQRRRLAEVIARRSDGLLLLTATPHDGYDPHFASLIELLDPSLVNGRGGVAGNGYRRHVVRRLKSHIRDPATGAPMFRDRCVIPVKIDIAGPAWDPVRRFHQALSALIAPRLRRGAAGREHANSLAFVSLLKRSVSTVAACVETLRTVAERYRAADVQEDVVVRRARARSLRALRRRLLRFGVLAETEESDLQQFEVEGMAANLHDVAASELLRLTGTEDTIAALGTLIELGEAAASHDPKLHALGREIRAIRAAAPAANVLVYTEYADSQAAVVRALRDSVDGEVLAISGADPERERTRIAGRFAHSDAIILVSTDSLAEGLNMQQRCCHLIHLDLPYNPNRLEQRNGRIDRYGQRHDPQIRYLYLAGTFEERLLLRLIAKYEAARAHLTFMPETLGVTADEDAWGSALVAGFAESQAGLFEDEPSPIRTLDHAAEAADADVYRDLLREIDRAFTGFDRSAARHGWIADSVLRGEPVGLATVANRCVAVDLADFVREAIALETGGASQPGDVLHLPPEWAAAANGLPGFDAATGTMRFTRDPDRLRDEADRSLGFLGRAHPLVRFAIGRVQRSTTAGADPRVSVAATLRLGNLAVLLTYVLEIRSAIGVGHRRMVAVLLDENGAATAVPDPAKWLRLAASQPQQALADIWRDHFSSWVPQQRCKAEAIADALMRRDTGSVTHRHQRACECEARDLDSRLRLRADTLCGEREPLTEDLFGAPPPGPDWRWRPKPLDRLAAFAADGSVSLEKRREADSIIELFQRRTKEDAARAALSLPNLRPLGLLMLVPAARA